MAAILCVPIGSPSAPHSMPETVAPKQAATFNVPLQNPFPVGTATSTLSFNLDLNIELVFDGLGKVLTSNKTVDRICVFTATPYQLSGTFKGTTFVDVRLDGTSAAVIRIDVV